MPDRKHLREPGAPPSRPVFPACLLLADRPCLVVGGGKTALRKVGHLLTAAARVRVVAPALHPDLAELVATGRVAHADRPFAPDDVAGCALAIAATDDGAVNRAVLAACRERGVWCNAADKHWMRGDLVTPAVLRRGELTVGISTGGRSCRRSRLVRDNLERHLAITDRADLLVVGTDHRRLDQAGREAVQADAAARERLGGLIMQVWGVHEFALLVTCNRVEALAVVGPEAATADLVERILGLDVLAPGERYRLGGWEAFAHVAAVNAGLVSQTPGEERIRGQLREALAAARAAGWAGGMLEDWLAAVARAGAAARAAAGADGGGSEIEDRCAAFLRDALADRDGPCVVVIGTGPVGRGVVERLAPGWRCRWCYRSAAPNPPPGADAVVEVVPPDGLPAALAGADAVVCASGAAAPVLTPANADGLPPAATVIDLGMPRNVDPALAARLGDRALDLDGMANRDGGGDDGLPAAARDAITARRADYAALLRRLRGDDGR